MFRATQNDAPCPLPMVVTASNSLIARVKTERLATVPLDMHTTTDMEIPMSFLSMPQHAPCQHYTFLHAYRDQRTLLIANLHRNAPRVMPIGILLASMGVLGFRLSQSGLHHAQELAASLFGDRMSLLTFVCIVLLCIFARVFLRSSKPSWKVANWMRQASNKMQRTCEWMASQFICLLAGVASVALTHAYMTWTADGVVLTGMIAVLTLMILSGVFATGVFDPTITWPELGRHRWAVRFCGILFAAGGLAYLFAFGL